MLRESAALPGLVWPGELQFQVHGSTRELDQIIQIQLFLSSSSYALVYMQLLNCAIELYPATHNGQQHNQV